MIDYFFYFGWFGNIFDDFFWFSNRKSSVMLYSENEPTSRFKMIQRPIVENAKAKHFPFMCAAFKINCWSIWRNILCLNMLRARLHGQNFMVNITHLNKSSTAISNIWLFSWYDLPFARKDRILSVTSKFSKRPESDNVIAVYFLNGQIGQSMQWTPW